MKEALLIFIKNPELGKAKTRLAATLGDKKALEIYHYLLAHTRQVSLDLPVKRKLYYSSFIDKNDLWSNSAYDKYLQDQSPDLGQKMYSAFLENYNEGIPRALIIGSDCLDLTPEILTEAYNLLSKKEAVIGPAKDGGYYSIGFNFERMGKESIHALQKLFLNKSWSHEKVFSEAISAFQELEIDYFEMPTLSDVDLEEDIKHLL